ncbi:VF530 family DNA-binding protein [Shewanella intestini]|uniref:DUF2132 domain-containing protein n=1 Tax=Shewanella intestini TaxID=2017544 RepID=A0ABS5I4I4_9GAMM|nr:MULTISPECIES: VF530 family protein [Shewanella]MBR9728940.1 DUF2132 domain-containing protein [Shewanella intestini]MRG36995.1 DNA-binding protein VF530 [Shewanella sp. XMDDZSB0408]
MTQQANNPLHGIKLEQIVTDLVDKYGWNDLAVRININCFKENPSIKSSLKFLRRTPWARDKVEYLWLKMNKQPLPSPRTRPQFNDNAVSSQDSGAVNAHIWGK